MKTLRAIGDFPFDNRSYRRGDVFQVSDEHAHVLVTIGQAEYVPPPNGYQVRDLKAGDAPAPSKKREYRRRDLKAEP